MASENLSNTITDALRQQIVDGTLPPGSRLKELHVAREHGVSRVPVREALRRLESEGFVISEPNRGAVVATPGPEQAASLLEVRAALEVLVARLAAERRTAEDLARLRATVQQGRDELAAGRTSPLVELSTRFHEAMAEASGNDIAVDMIGQLRRKMQWVYAGRLHQRADKSWYEHETILAAVESGDADAAAFSVGAHIHNAQRAYDAAGPGGSVDAVAPVSAS